MKQKSMLATLAVAFVSLQASTAQDIAMSKVIADWRTSAILARVVINDPGALWIARLTEEQMNRYGCTYSGRVQRACVRLPTWSSVAYMSRSTIGVKIYFFLR
jgi:hypothetical protein